MKNVVEQSFFSPIHEKGHTGTLKIPNKFYNMVTTKA